MKFFTRLRVGFRQWQRRRAAQRQKGPLREFVYLDEVSVYSLNASRHGPIAAEFTETQTTSLQGEVGGSLGVNTGVAKADLNPRLLRNQTAGSQVLRKSIVQTTFKELYELELENESLAIRPIPEDQKCPSFHSSTDLITDIKMLAGNVWIIDPENLKRGNLFELELQLESEAIFNLGVMASAIHEILEEDAEILGVDSAANLIQMKSISRILEKLLVGLVPIRGKAINYCVVKLDGKEWIIHRWLLDQLSDTNSLSIRPLFIVGVAEQALFWKDIRRILFSKAHYNVLCRASQGGIQNSWTPVKLAHVFETVMPPEIANQMNFTRLNEIAKVADISKSGQNVESKQQRVCTALVNYANLLAKHHHIDLSPQNLEQIVLLANQNCLSFSNHDERYKAFESIATYLMQSFNIENEPLIFAEHRELALKDAGLDILGNSITLPTSNDTVSLTSSQEERFLDSEFVAIYW
jgi:hypothetical protein